MTGEMPRPRPPYLQREKTRHGKLVWYVRRPSEAGPGPRIRIRAEFGTPEFEAEYAAALAGVAPPRAGRPRSGTLQWLYDRYRETAAWTDLAIATRRQRQNIFAAVMAVSGHEPFGDIDRRNIVAGIDRRRETPSQARHFLDAMRGMFVWALDAGMVRSDPTAGVKGPRRRKTDGFPAWTMDDVAAYEARWAAGTSQRVWLHVLLYIGSRRGDAVRHGRQHVKNGILTFVTEKGRERIEVTRRIEPELAATLARGPCGDLTFICGERGMPLTKESFGNAFKEACVKAGIANKSAHGLRKLSATIWAERGASESELMAMYGWVTPRMAALYTKSARRRQLSLGAEARLSGTRGEHPIPAPDHEVRETAEK